MQSKHQNLTKHQHDFCVGDLNMNMCCSNTESTVNVDLELGQILAKDVTWLQQGTELSAGDVHLRDGSP